MGETKDIEAQSALLIGLGEPEAWLETMLRASRREALQAGEVGNEELAARWRKLTRALEYAAAAAAPHPLTEAAAPASEGDTGQPG